LIDWWKSSGQSGVTELLRSAGVPADVYSHVYIASSIRDFHVHGGVNAQDIADLLTTVMEDTPGAAPQPSREGATAQTIHDYISQHAPST
jgi:hypothetical protein